MVRRFSVALLSLSLLSTAALAQSATAADGAPTTPPPPHEGMHRGGPGPIGMRMAIGHVPAPVTNVPFSAKFTSTLQMKDREGKQVEHSGARAVYRDSLGRTREDVTLPPRPPHVPRQDAGSTTLATPQTPPAPRTMTVIFDPVANTITRLSPERKVAFVQTVPADFFKHAERREEFQESGKGHRGKDAVVTDLGSKTFAGVVAQGERVSHTLPSRDGEATRTMTHETWFAPDLKLEVSDTDTMERGTHSDVVTSLTKAEPDASLFKVPEGYAIQKAPERPFAGRGHQGRGGPGGPPDAPLPPPPPAM